MSKEVTELRRNGRFEEAYELAKQELSEDRWSKTSMFWALRDYVKNIILPTQDITQVQSFLNEMSDLLTDMVDDEGFGERAYQGLSIQILPNANVINDASNLSKTDPTTAYQNIVNVFGASGEGMSDIFHENYGWIIYRYLKANTDTLSSVQVRGILRDYMNLHNDRPSILHSTILNYALQYSKGHSDFNFYNFFNLWGVNNLRTEDFQDNNKDGNVIPSLISRICQVIVNSNINYDINEFIESFESKRRVDVLDHLRQSCFWKLWNLQKNGDTTNLCQSFESYAKQYTFDISSRWHSEILKIANRFIPQDNSLCFFNFVKLWYGTGKFLSGDWKKTISEDGTEYPSLVVKTAKRCFEALRSNSQLHNIENVNWLKSLYKSIYEKDSEDDWSIRNYAQLCKQTGNKQETIEIYKKLLLDKGDKYYLWSELAECIEDDNALKLGLLLKAIRLEKNEDFLGDLHLDLAKAWLDEGYGANAKIELDKYAQHRKSKGWNISDAYRTQSDQVSKSDNSMHSDDSIYLQQADDFVFSAFEWKDYVLIDKWTHKGIERCSFFDGESSYFSVKTKRFSILKHTHPGDIVSWKCKGTNAIVPLVAKNSEREKWSLLPLKYGIIDYINNKKQVLHIITQDNKLVFCQINNQNYKIGDFVNFCQYEKAKNTANNTLVFNICICKRDEVLPNMPSRVVVVDDVNDVKQLFHIVLGRNKISDIVRYSETAIRPKVGDFLKISYYVTKTKNGVKHIKCLDLATSDVGFDGVKRTVSGTLRVRYRDEDNSEQEYPDFAFVEDIYVHRDILKKCNITEDCEVVAKVVLGGDNKWKVYDLELSQNEQNKLT